MGDAPKYLPMAQDSLPPFPKQRIIQPHMSVVPQMKDLLQCEALGSEQQVENKPERFAEAKSQKA